MGKTWAAIVLAGWACFGAAGMGRALAAPAEPLAGPGADLSVEIVATDTHYVFPGMSKPGKADPGAPPWLPAGRHVFQATDGVDAGDFVSPVGKFTQRCIRVTRKDCPLTVFFRPDRDGGRVEVVFELGRCFSTADAGGPANLGPYKAVIRRGDKDLATVQVPYHNWFARWRWQSSPRPVVRTPADVVAGRFAPPYSAKVGWSRAASKPAEYTIMGHAGLTLYMPQTGQTMAMGMLTKPQAEWLAGGGQGALASVFAQAEACASVPWHQRDEKTGAPLSLDQYPKASFRAPDQPQLHAAKTEWTPDASHQQSLVYLPYVLTGDPYYLEELQAVATFNWLVSRSDYRAAGKGLIHQEQTRGYAWKLRTLAQCIKATPEKVPGWLLPQSYFAARLENNRLWLEENFVKSADPVTQAFRKAPRGPLQDVDHKNVPRPNLPGVCAAIPWQEDFVATTLGVVVFMGFEAWRPAFEWKLGSTIARTDGASGWVRAEAVPYCMEFRRSKDEPFAKTWAEAWQITNELAKFTIADPNHVAEAGYLPVARSALALGVTLNVPGAKECYDWADAELSRFSAPITWSIVPLPAPATRPDAPGPK